jgi:hypothetical protein
MVPLIHFYILDFNEGRFGLLGRSITALRKELDSCKYKVGTFLLAGILLLLSLLNCILPDKELSDTERRKLKQLPPWSFRSFLDKSYGENFDEYALDQFPYREAFRRLKAVTLYGLFQEKDNNGIYLVDGYAAKLNYPLNENSLKNAIDKFNDIYDTYLVAGKGEIYSCVVPDKGYYLAEQNNYPAMNYEELFHMIREGMDYSQYIDITDCLEIEDYYRTDTHWNQIKLIPVANRLAEKMGFLDLLSNQYEVGSYEKPFYGVYYGQSALPLQSETISYLTNNRIHDSQVYHHETKERTPVYEFEKLNSKDPYEMFLSGADPLLTIENPQADTKKELIIFRDSFASSLAPLLLEGYAKITLVDIRYIKSSILGNYIDFNNQDVLFLYSTLILNDSYSFK